METWARVVLVLAALVGIGLGSLGLWHSAKTGDIGVWFNHSGKEAVYNRKREPVRFWLSVVFLGGLVCVAGLVVALAILTGP